MGLWDACHDPLLPPRGCRGCPYALGWWGSWEVPSATPGLCPHCGEGAEHGLWGDVVGFGRAQLTQTHRFPLGLHPYHGPCCGGQRRPARLLLPIQTILARLW